MYEARALRSKKKTTSSSQYECRNRVHESIALHWRADAGQPICYTQFRENVYSVTRKVYTKDIILKCLNLR